MCLRTRGSAVGRAAMVTWMVIVLGALAMGEASDPNGGFAHRCLVGSAGPELFRAPSKIRPAA